MSNYTLGDLRADVELLISAEGSDTEVVIGSDNCFKEPKISFDTKRLRKKDGFYSESKNLHGLLKKYVLIRM